MSHDTVMVTGLWDIEKDEEGSETNNIISHDNSLLILWQVYVLYGRLV